MPEVNCMMITSSMCPLQLFQKRFQLYTTDINIFIPAAKKNTLKGTETENVFRAHFIMDPDLRSPVR